eukprot:CAMPEP_0171233146 /NCGR_PEP_ID=MMETSP0790-20130122/40769_1 /TAXON_ID=2925 /ORGANISM="Alexandrium catenella, Strain OF101" /LENGTH=267 /DNA_ID=CAMNT_0011699395 /DNA_START=86 /DNA_END=889 /DNA_ORIENTATION=-
MAAFVLTAPEQVSVRPLEAVRALRGVVPPSQAPLPREPGVGVSLAPVGIAALAGAIGGVVKQRRSRRTVQKATSYKDFQDPWLGAADLGFDPLNLSCQGGIFDKAASAVPETTYYNYRESEVKHGRFAMTAFLAIFFDSADRGAVFRQLGSSSATDTLDGSLGLDELQGPVIGIALGYQALAEYNLQRSEDDGNFLSVEYKKDRCPGDLGFDPLKLGSSADADKKGLHNVEVNAGRLAMIGITSFLWKEFLFKDETIAAKLLSDSAI